MGGCSRHHASPLQFAIHAGLYGSDSNRDFGGVLLNLRPARRWQDENSDSPMRQILLILEILIRREEQLESGRFRSREQISLAHLRPSALVRGVDGMTNERVTKRNWRTLVGKDAHGAGTRGLVRRGEALLGMCQNSERLFADDSGKPFQKIIHRGACF